MNTYQPVMASIVLNGLNIGFRKPRNRITVYGPVNASIRENEMVALIGRNGIGKSTLLRTIAGLQPPTGGEIKLNGISVQKIGLKDMSRMVSYVSTEPVHGFRIRVDEIIALGRFPYSGWLGKLNEIDRQAISDAVQYTGIAGLLNKSIHEISDGERQKVMIARALAQDTPIIILDEPTAFLDLPARYEILRILNDLSIHNKKTILFSTHDLELAIDVADKLWVMTGDEMFQGAPEDLLINNVFRNLFLSSPAEFDEKTLQFRFYREFSHRIRITGDDSLRALTQKSMERIGIGITGNDSDLVIKIDKRDDKHSWLFKDSHSEQLFNSVYDLVSYLKKYLLK